MANVKVSPEVRFQSLFWWNFVWGYVNHKLQIKEVVVSILVLVEFRLGGNPLPSAIILFGCFNPCSGGISSGGRIILNYMMKFTGFNPCSGGISSGGILCRNINPKLYWFQSLFWWNFVWGT